MLYRSRTYRLRHGHVYRGNATDEGQTLIISVQCLAQSPGPGPVLGTVSHPTARPCGKRKAPAMVLASRQLKATGKTYS